MKTVLAALNAKYVHSNLAVYDIEAYTRNNWINEYKTDDALHLVVKEYTINHNLDLIMQSIYKENADLIAFSCYIWNISEILTVCRELKKVSPNISIWLGGPEVSYDSEELLNAHDYIDGVIQGEGEATFYELVKLYSDPLEQMIYKGFGYILGIVYRASDGSIHTNPPRPLISMDDIPFIDTDLSMFENKILYYESSRGCPFSCSYCLSSIDKRVRFRNLTLVKDELTFFMDNKVPQVKFIDRTFNCDRKRAREIWRYLLENDNGVTNFHFEIAADLIEDEDLDIFRRMRQGLIQLEIGLQSTNDTTIHEIRRVMDIDKLKHNMLEIRKMGNIHQHLDLIAGLPYEDYESFVGSFNDAYAMRPNQLQLGFLKVLKGSYMEEQVKDYGLVYRDEQPYEVLSTKWISYGEILSLKQVEDMVEVYYNSDQFEHVLPYLHTFFETPFDMFESLGKYYEKHELTGIGFKRESRYSVLRDFFLEYISDFKCREDLWKYKFIDMIFGEDYEGWDTLNNYSVNGRNLDISMIDSEYDRGHEVMAAIFDSLLTFDYYLRENAKSRPEWRKNIMIEKGMYNNFFKNGGTEELSLVKEGYDSKVAARSMHIEPVVNGACRWIYSDNLAESNESVVNGDDNCSHITLMYAVFDYNDKNPLTGDASFRIISHL